jgi:putative aldouronate transport system permease protein
MSSKDKMLFNMVSYIFISLVSIFCLIPILVIISGSFTDEHYIIKHGFGFIPRVFSTQAYSTLLKNPLQIIRAYGITIYVTVVGTVLGLFITAMTAFVLSLRSFPWANRISFFFYFTTLFSGGLVPWYILCVQYLKFKENPLIALVLPSLLNVFHLMVMKSFLKATIQDSVVESAKIDGASYFRIFIQIILPLSKPALATIGLFIALGYWNDWFLAFLFVTKEEYFPMQYYLYRMINTADALLQLAARSNISIGKLPKESSKMAMAVIAVGPILFLYPYVQKYFVKGLTIGAVKG